MSDLFEEFSPGLDSPSSHAAEVTPDDGTDLAMASRAIWVGTPGDLRVTTIGGDTVTLTGAMGLLPIRAKRILATGTTASGLVALW